MSDYFNDQIEAAKTRVPTMEHMLGKGLLQPFNNTNSGPRKIMHGVHRDHIFPLYNGEKAIAETGYEIRFGDESSSVIATDSDYEVVAKIPKYSFSPNHQYYLIMKDLRSKKLDVIERICYHYTTEEYGYLNNTDYLDSLQIGQKIPEDTIVMKSLAFDEYNNRKDGLNLDAVYMSLDLNMEDSLIILDEVSDLGASPLLKYVTVMINENNIPLNLYGDDKVYKCIPDIGEDIKDSVFIGLRKEKKEEMVFSESVDHLKKLMMSDEKKLLNGKVIDINIYCNNPENLNQYHNQQFKMYYDEQQRMSQEIVSVVTQFIVDGYEISYELKKLYATSKRIINKDQFIDKNTFSNIILEAMVLERLPIREGDKMANRYGGKGVVSKILPRELMPRKSNGEPIQIIFNEFTMPNRENPGQIFELHQNHVGHGIIEHIKKNNLSLEEAIELVSKFLDIVVPAQAQEFKNMISRMTKDEIIFFMESIIRDEQIHTSAKPISESMDIDKLEELYDAFPFVESEYLQVPIIDSNGNIRYVNTRRRVIAAKEYVFRLKQFAEEKFSATSLSATNLKGENAKSKASKNYNELYSNTPIRKGNMEINNELHLGVEAVMENLMIHSVSPDARKLVRKFYTGNPYKVDIKLDQESSNRGAEIINTRLKTIGRRLVFKKVKKNRVKMPISPFYFTKQQIIKPFMFVHDDSFDAKKYYEELDKINEQKKTKPGINPFRFTSIDVKRRRKQVAINKLAYEEMKLNPRQKAEKREREEE